MAFAKGSNTNGSGVIDNNNYTKHTINLSNTSTFLNEKLTISPRVLFSQQESLNRLYSGLYNNPLTGLYTSPRGLDLNYYKTNYEIASTTEKDLYRQNWYDMNWDRNRGSGQDFEQNPYWLINRTNVNNLNKKLIASLLLKYQFDEHLSLQARGNMDYNTFDYSQNMYTSTQATQATETGRYINSQTATTYYYGDLLAVYNNKFGDISLNSILGTSISNTSTYNQLADGQLSQFNVFAIQNIKQGGTNSQFTQNKYSKQLQAIFASIQVGWKNKLFADITARNDWSSALAFTNTFSYFYPSFGLSGIVTEFAKLPEFVNFWKVRASYSLVGNDLPAGATRPINSVNSLTGSVVNNTIGFLPGQTLKPEQTTSLELGTEIRLFKNYLDIDFTWYQNNTINQYFLLNAPSGSAFSKIAINAGNIQNRGFELSINSTPIALNNFKWSMGLNFSRNQNTVVALDDKLGNEYFLTLPGVNNFASVVRKDGSFGDIYGIEFAKDAQGRILLAADSTPIANSKLTYLGNPTPKLLMGFRNTFKIYDFDVSFFIDARLGGEVMSMTEAVLDKYGASQRTADARDNGGYVSVNGATSDGTAINKVKASLYYNTVGGRDGITGNYVYDATNVRLREVSLSYNLPKQYLSATRFIKGVKLSFIARNLYFFYIKAPFDPEITMSTGNGLQGIDVFSVPSTMSIGGSLKINL